MTRWGKKHQDAKKGTQARRAGEGSMLKSVALGERFWTLAQE